MKVTQSDTTDTQTATATRKAPRPRTAPADKATKVSAASHNRAMQQFQSRAQDWLLDRHDRQVEMPADLDAVTRLGVPCPNCGALIYRHRDAGHPVEFKRVPGQHWAAGITTSCA